MADARAVATQAATNWALMYPIPAWGLADGPVAEKLAESWLTRPDEYRVEFRHRTVGAWTEESA